MLKTALVLSGGGAGGAFQIGVLQRIWGAEKENIEAIYGTSVGALNAAALKYMDLPELKKIWLSIKGRSDIMTFNPLVLLGLARGKYKTGPLKSLIGKVFISPIANPHIKVKVSVVRISTGEIHYISDSAENFPDMVLASASVPFHMEPVGDFVDGGVRDHTPIQEAINDGYTRIIVISNNPWGRKQNDVYKESWPYFIDIGLRCTDILQAEVLFGDLMAIHPGVEIIRYAPDTRIIETFEYDHEKIVAAMMQGYTTNGKS